MEAKEAMGDIDSRYLGVWQNITRAHSRRGSYGLPGVKSLWHTHDYLSVFQETKAWKETFSLLEKLPEESLNVIGRYADVNLMMAAEQLKLVGLCYGLFVVFVLAGKQVDVGTILTILVAPTSSKIGTGIRLILASVLVILAILVAAGVLMGHRKAFLIKKCIDCYMAATSKEK